MKKGLNFRTIESQKEYYDTYDDALKLLSAPFVEKYVATSFGDSHVICCGNEENPPLVLLHAASCGSLIWYKNIPFWSTRFCVYAIDLIGESSKSVLTRKMKTTQDNAQWLDETLAGLGLDQVFLCGLSIGGWNAANYAGFYPQKVKKLILLSPVQTFAKMHPSFFMKIMKMGFNPTRENVENYIGWGSEKEEPLPDSIIKLFTISVMNMNSNASFPKWLKKNHLLQVNMPVLVMMGENEFAFSVDRATKRAESTISHLELDVVAEASHLLCASKPDEINRRMVEFLLK
ncbi:alpha/beta fold hydrolase [Xiamenia xianingshaonis]|uniref:Alpha/beta fold hydrolase n=1 Tax=Xiamenia xianingshaonis TaxID=2682776 RepID=A0A9E6MQE3_9ACTN|nr:alpha/beta hydrolase [Xiamenia xianingshaonis]NHM14159.1 alpha/beta fold hydrolase [Xiamenia xianingshaonis]QTU84225.1 alpha/beta hydrolase [Xiamenia xianingshaonis]